MDIKKHEAKFNLQQIKAGDRIGVLCDIEGTNDDLSVMISEALDAKPEILDILERGMLYHKFKKAKKEGKSPEEIRDVLRPALFGKLMDLMNQTPPASPNINSRIKD